MANPIPNTPLNNTVILRGKVDQPAVVHYAISRLKDGDCDCYKKYMAIANELNNINYFFSLVPYYTTEGTDNVSIDGIVCLFNRLISILNTLSAIPGILTPSDVNSLFGQGIGFMMIDNTIGQGIFDSVAFYVNKTY